MTPSRIVGPTNAPAGSASGRLAAVDDQRRALLDAAVDPAADAVARRARDDRADVDALVEAVADAQPLGRLAQRRACSRSCASPTVTTTEPAMQRWPAAPNAEPMMPSTVLSITASGMTTMWFFAPPSAWTRLPALRRALVDELRDRRRADERDGVDARMVEDPLDHLAAAVDEVDDAGRQVEPVEHLEGDLLRQRDLLGGLEDERVAAGDRERQEPERHHRREVERHDRRAHADRLAHGLGVDVARDVLEDAALHRRRHRARALDHLDHARDLGAGVDERLAHLGRHRAREVLLARVEPLAQREQLARAVDRR